MKRWISLLSVLVAVIAIVLVWRSFRELSLTDIHAAVTQLRADRLIMTGVFTALSYATLTGFDWLGTRYAGHRLPYPKVALTAFTSLSLGHTIGMAPISSGAVRYRFYSRWGLSLADIAAVIAFSALTVTVGQTGLAAVTLLWRPEAAARLLNVDPMDARLLGGACIALLAVYAGLAAKFGGRRLTLFKWSLMVPTLPLATGQIVVGTVNFAFVAAALQQALSSTIAVDYPTAAAAYLLANLAVMVSHVPGGLGVMEAAVLLLLPKSQAIAGVLAFRAIYFFIPFGIGLVVFAIAELVRSVAGRSVGDTERSTLRMSLRHK